MPLKRNAVAGNSQQRDSVKAAPIARKNAASRSQQPQLSVMEPRYEAYERQKPSPRAATKKIQKLHRNGDLEADDEDFSPRPRR